MGYLVLHIPNTKVNDKIKLSTGDIIGIATTDSDQDGFVKVKNVKYTGKGRNCYKCHPNTKWNCDACDGNGEIFAVGDEEFLKNKELLQRYYILEKEAYQIASEYANKMMEHGGSVYTGIRFTGDYFNFQYGPSTHGLSFPKSLHIELLSDPDYKEELSQIITKDKEGLELKRKKNTCATCGHRKDINDGFTFPIY